MIAASTLHCERKRNVLKIKKNWLLATKILKDRKEIPVSSIATYIYKRLLE